KAPLTGCFRWWIHEPTLDGGYLAAPQALVTGEGHAAHGDEDDARRDRRRVLPADQVRREDGNLVLLVVAREADQRPVVRQRPAEVDDVVVHLASERIGLGVFAGRATEGGDGRAENDLPNRVLERRQEDVGLRAGSPVAFNENLELMSLGGTHPTA